MPSSTTALGFPIFERDIFGGWSAQGADRLAILDKSRVTNWQMSVAKAIREYTAGDLVGAYNVFTECKSSSHCWNGILVMWVHNARMT